MKSGSDDFYGQMAALANEDFDNEEEVCGLNMCRKMCCIAVS